MGKQYPGTCRHKREKSIHGGTTVARYSSPSVEQLAIHLPLDSMLLCGGQNESLASQSVPSKTHPGTDEVTLKWWYFLIAVVLFKCGAKKSVQSNV